MQEDLFDQGVGHIWEGAPVDMENGTASQEQKFHPPCSLHLFPPNSLDHWPYPWGRTLALRLRNLWATTI